jgi:hypothetical protein
MDLVFNLSDLVFNLSDLVQVLEGELSHEEIEIFLSTEWGIA